jgi:hypothetical protein
MGTDLILGSSSLGVREHAHRWVVSSALYELCTVNEMAYLPAVPLVSDQEVEGAARADD